MIEKEEESIPVKVKCMNCNREFNSNAVCAAVTVMKRGTSAKCRKYPHHKGLHESVVLVEGSHCEIVWASCECGEQGCSVEPSRHRFPQTRDEMTKIIEQQNHNFVCGECRAHG
jgi:hypothetical protein